MRTSKKGKERAMRILEHRKLFPKASQAQLAKLLRVSECTISNILKEYGDKP